MKAGAGLSLGILALGTLTLLRCERQAPPPVVRPPLPTVPPTPLEPWRWHFAGGILVIQGELNESTELILKGPTLSESWLAPAGPVRWELLRPPPGEVAELRSGDGKLLATWDFDAKPPAPPVAKVEPPKPPVPPPPPPPVRIVPPGPWAKTEPHLPLPRSKPVPPPPVAKVEPPKPAPVPPPPPVRIVPPGPWAKTEPHLPLPRSKPVPPPPVAKVEPPKPAPPPPPPPVRIVPPGPWAKTEPHLPLPRSKPVPPPPIAKVEPPKPAPAPPPPPVRIVPPGPWAKTEPHLPLPRSKPVPPPPVAKVEPPKPAPVPPPPPVRIVPPGPWAKTEPHLPLPRSKPVPPPPVAKVEPPKPAPVPPPPPVRIVPPGPWAKIEPHLPLPRSKPVPPPPVAKVEPLKPAPAPPPPPVRIVPPPPVAKVEPPKPAPVPPPHPVQIVPPKPAPVAPALPPVAKKQSVPPAPPVPIGKLTPPQPPVPATPSLPVKPLPPVAVSAPSRPAGGAESGQDWPGAGEGLNLVRGPRGEKRICMTFDGGSTAEVAVDVLDALHEHGIKTTIFLTGEFIRKYPDLVRRMAAEGHELGNHTMNHPHLAPHYKRDPQWTKERVQKELLDADRAFYHLLGRPMDPYWRPPYGEQTAELRQWAEEIGYRTVSWSEGADTLDWATVKEFNLYRNGTATIERLEKRMRKADGDGLIVLMHLGSLRPALDRPAKYLGPFMDRAIKDGWHFVCIGDYLKAMGRTRWESSRRVARINQD